MPSNHEPDSICPRCLKVVSPEYKGFDQEFGENELECPLCGFLGLASDFKIVEHLER